MNHFRAFANSVASAARDISRDIQTSFDDNNKGTGRKYEIGSRTVREEKLLSEGGFGFVYLVRDVITNDPFVIKKILCQDKERYDLACREVEIFEKLPVHANLVKYYGHIIEKESRNKEVIILLEFCPGGHLYDMMQKQNSRVPTNHIIKVLKDVVGGLVALQRMDPPVQHRDLKLENVLMSSSGSYVLLDFGSWSSASPDVSKLSREELMQFGEIVERYTTLMYRPPEMADLYKGFKISGQVDVWMLGCILFTLINNYHPFQNASNLAIVNCRYSFNQDECKRYPAKLIQLCAWLLAQNPVDRPTAQQLVTILNDWDQRLEEPLPLPSSVIERIEKDARLYNIPSMARGVKTSSSPRQSFKAAAPQTDSSGWGSSPPESEPAGGSWEASFDLLGVAADASPAKKQVSATSQLPDLLG